VSQHQKFQPKGDQPLPLIAPKKRAAKQRDDYSTEDYVIEIVNFRKSALPALLGSNDSETPRGMDIVDLIQSFGYEARIIRKDDYFDE
jgi:hypothetical protein